MIFKTYPSPMVYAVTPQLLCFKTALERQLWDVTHYHQHFLLNLFCAINTTLFQLSFYV